jgi:hypothetical protein
MSIASKRNDIMFAKSITAYQGAKEAGCAPSTLLAMTLEPNRTRGLTAPLLLIATLLCIASPSQAVPINVNISSTTATPTKSEVSIDINPTNPNNLVVISHSGNLQTMQTFYSFDKGQTWTNVNLGNAFDGITSTLRFDPTVAFDADGNVYVAYGVDDGNKTAVIVGRSGDGGQTYTATKVAETSNPTGLLKGNDKWILATGPDPVDASKQNVYIAWTQNTGTEQKIVLSGSKDGGVTFSAPVKINDSTKNGQLFAEPVVGKDGKVYVSWQDIRTGGNVLLDVSTDAGTTWGNDKIVTGWNASFGNGFAKSIPAQASRGMGVGPTIEANQSSGRIFEAYVDVTGTLPNTDIFVRYSDDDGTTWSAPIKVNDDIGINSQFLPWMDFDPVKGFLGLAWYDARNDVNNTDVDVYVAFSFDDGVTFGENMLLTDGIIPPSSYGGNFLEYIGLAGYDHTFHAVWSESIAGASGTFANLDIVTTHFRVSEPSSLVLITFSLVGLGFLRRRAP